MDVGGFELKTCKKCNNGVWVLPTLTECPYCGATDFVEYGSNLQLNSPQKSKKHPRKGFTDEECLALGLYPKDEVYKMSLISKILGRR